MKFSVANDFSKFPAGEFKDDGPFSGEHLREKLVELLGKGEYLLINLDGVAGYGSSFLRGAFLGLGERWVSVFSKDPELVSKVEDYLNDD